MCTQVPVFALLPPASCLPDPFLIKHSSRLSGTGNKFPPRNTTSGTSLPPTTSASIDQGRPALGSELT